jgi:GSH-dependent disulfide-bond oxidoreductase
VIDVYAWSTMNARKIYIMLEETGLPYRIHPVNISKGEQFKPEFLAISPNNKTPAIIDRDGPGGGDYSLFESGAILMYLADKTGRFLPADPAARSTVIQWLMWQMGDFGPMLGQAEHFVPRRDQRSMATALDRFIAAANRLMGVMDRRLAESEYLRGDAYSIADIATYPWCQNPERCGVRHEDYPNLKRWFDLVASRPAVSKAEEIAAQIRSGAIAAQ